MKKTPGLSQLAIAGLLVAVLIASVAIIILSQALVERDALTLSPSTNASNLREQREIDKLAAQIRQIRSDTAGSLFWLKMIALFVTVGGAVGGYLVGQSQMTRKRIDFEDRKNVDTIYQSIVQELSAEAPLLRAAAAVKLGMVLQSFPVEWNVSDERRKQLVQLTIRGRTIPNRKSRSGMAMYATLTCPRQQPLTPIGRELISPTPTSTGPT